MISTKYPLMDHQRKAYEKLRSLKVGALYMDMGTGKTRTMIEIAKDKINAGKAEKVVWFCPCSAKINIRKEIEKQLTQGFEHFIIVGIESMSSSISLNSYMYRYVREYRCIMVIDEASKIKNHAAKRTERITKLGEHCKYRYILNGTPVTRDERDLYSQWYFLDWRILGYASPWSFARNHVIYDDEIYTKVVGTKNVDYLSRRIAPYTYQVKLDECVDLPEKVYDEYDFTLDHGQVAEYDRWSYLLLDQINEWRPSTIYRLFNTLQAITAGFDVEYDDTSKHKIRRVMYRDTEDTNPRLEALINILDNLSGKVIIFCQYTAEIVAISSILSEKYGKNSVAKFYGEMSQKKRDESISQFQDSARFLVANKSCAGYSLNLQFCHQVIYYNNDWDYGTRSQSEDRVHRIGQDRKCLYIDIVASDTLESYIVTCLSRKERLADAFTRDVNRYKSVKEIIGLQKPKKKNKETIKVLDNPEES